MKNLTGLLLAATVLLCGAWACNMSTASLSSLKTSRDSDGSQETTTYKAGDTIYAHAAVTSNPGKVTVKMYITVDDAPGMKKGDQVPNSEVKVDLDGDGRAKYNFPTFPTTQGGKFNIVADMLNESGEKKDSKTVSITVQSGSPGGPTSKTSDEDDK